jgi:hypothetical protein
LKRGSWAVGHGGDEARLAGAGRAVEQVPALPRLADPPVVLLSPWEAVEVGDDGLLQLRLQGDRTCGRNVASPRDPLLVHEDIERALPPPLLLHSISAMMEGMYRRSATSMFSAPKLSASASGPRLFVRRP